MLIPKKSIFMLNTYYKPNKKIHMRITFGNAKVTYLIEVMSHMWTQATIMLLGFADVGVVWKVTETQNAHLLIWRRW